jgi:hypothetical protein
MSYDLSRKDNAGNIDDIGTAVAIQGSFDGYRDTPGVPLHNRRAAEKTRAELMESFGQYLPARPHAHPEYACACAAGAASARANRGQTE